MSVGMQEAADSIGVVAIGPGFNLLAIILLKYQLQPTIKLGLERRCCGEMLRLRLA
jgi:hypothetical protein